MQDYIGWGIGIGAIILSILIFNKQFGLSKEFHELQQSHKIHSLRTIVSFLVFSVHELGRNLTMIEGRRARTQIDFNYINGILEWRRELFSPYCENMLRETEFLRQHIHPDIYEEIRRVITRIRVLNDPREFYDVGDFDESLEFWYLGFENTIDEISQLADHIRIEFES